MAKQTSTTSTKSTNTNTSTNTKKQPTSAADKEALELQKLEAPSKLGSSCVAFGFQTIKKLVTTLVSCVSNSFSELDNASGEILIEFKQDSDFARLTYTCNGALAKTKVPAKVFKQGGFVAPVSLFKALKHGAKFIILSTEKDDIVYKIGNTRGKIPTSISPEEFKQSIRKVDIEPSLEINRTELVSSVDRILFPSFDPSLPAMGLPVTIQKIGKHNLLQLSSNDHIVGALANTIDKTHKDFKTLVPAAPFQRILKNLTGSTVMFGFDDAQFVMKDDSIVVSHPVGNYDIVEMSKFLKEEFTLEPDFEIRVNTQGILDALENSLSISVIDNSEQKIALEMSTDEGKGRAIFQGQSGSKSSTGFKIIETIHVKSTSNKSKSGKKAKDSNDDSDLSINTDGSRLLKFMSLFKHSSSIILRVRDGRLFIYNMESKPSSKHNKDSSRKDATRNNATRNDIQDKNNIITQSPMIYMIPLV